LFKKVSVIIPTYNRPKVLLKSIETVINQTYPGEIEIIIIDDSKKSQKKEIESKFKSKISRKRNIKYIHHAKKKGSPYARNIGIKESTGEYIAFLDDDDEWMAEKIEEQVKILNNDDYKNIELCVSWILDKRFGKERINKTPNLISHKYVIDALNLQSTSAYMFRARSLKEQGGFDLELASAQEYDLALRISKKNPIISIPKILVIQNETKGQISENWTRKIKGIFAVRKKYKKDFSLPNHIKIFALAIAFSFGFIFGNRIYNILTYFKEVYNE